MERLAANLWLKEEVLHALGQAKSGGLRRDVVAYAKAADLAPVLASIST